MSDDIPASTQTEQLEQLEQLVFRHLAGQCRIRKPSEFSPIQIGSTNNGDKFIVQVCRRRISSRLRE